MYSIRFTFESKKQMTGSHHHTLQQHSDMVCVCVGVCKQ